MGGHWLCFGDNMPGRTPQIWKNWASLMSKVTVSVSPKILQLEVWSEMFSAKYCLSGPI